MIGTRVYRLSSISFTFHFCFTRWLWFEVVSRRYHFAYQPDFISVSYIFSSTFICIISFSHFSFRMCAKLECFLCTIKFALSSHSSLSGILSRFVLLHGMIHWQTSTNWHTHTNTHSCGYPSKLIIHKHIDASAIFPHREKRWRTNCRLHELQFRIDKIAYKFWNSKRFTYTNTQINTHTIAMCMRLLCFCICVSAFFACIFFFSYPQYNSLLRPSIPTLRTAIKSLASEPVSHFRGPWKQTILVCHSVAAPHKQSVLPSTPFAAWLKLIQRLFRARK